ncbi:aminotransferase class I/II-fold pyridoxal phosphate-dependent enzyme [Pseudorhodoplanes sp.]|uniref:aminotransferase class I/II-fold pyridoxal phosphate-dependent enzyme n=1 Tax=Pseudorhodoplanes sp. TaxID=1934341 RepID=UPI002C706B2B|nr:aminotransferase class I/II-fold pyridoxal phosphate-dependent enzyme [Pseudorhodoplanes sp.]HWV40978.1 aminotransferase class I/II-fold pyridoxal phosphate-dependent enzyme [Pseudorhodoplanes sp.]
MRERANKPVVGGRVGARTLLDGRPVILLTANNYLGLAGDPEVIEAACAAARDYGNGTTLNPPLATTPLHEALCDTLAEFHATDAALLFNSCTAANVTVACTLVGKGDVIFSDRLNHASIIDGCRLSAAETRIYNNRDLDHLEALLKQPHDGAKLVITDGIFSMEGDAADLPRMIALCRRHGATLVVDESHAAGVTGPGGRGTAAARGCLGEVDLYTGTLSKAFGGFAGGYVAGRADLIEKLHDHGRFWMFTTAIPPASAGGALAAIRRLMQDDALMRQLADNTERLRKGLKALGLTILGHDHPITPILVGDEDKARAFSAELLKDGVYIGAICFPIVRRGEARLRAQPSAAHSTADIDEAIAIIGAAARRTGLIG